MPLKPLREIPVTATALVGAGAFTVTVAAVPPETGRDVSLSPLPPLSAMPALDVRSRRSEPVPVEAPDVTVQVVAGAERYYRAMLSGSIGSWNIRDRHMAKTLDRLLSYYGPGAKGVVWAHNTHVGDARATDMATIGEINIGQLARETYGRDSVVLVGFGCHRGTVVAGPKLEQPLSLASYTEGVRRQGRTPRRTLVTLDRFPCPDALAAETGLTRGEPVWHLERVLLADDERVGLESTYVAVARFPRLGADFDPDSSFYGYLKGLGIAFGDADERIETVLATPREALLIGTPPALPMLLIHRVSRDAEGRPLERVRTLYRGDRFSFTTHLRG